MITPSELRQNLYNLLDQVIKIGQPLKIKRIISVLKIVKGSSKGKLDQLKKRDVLNCEPDEIINNNWEIEDWTYPACFI